MGNELDFSQDLFPNIPSVTAISVEASPPLRGRGGSGGGWGKGVGLASVMMGPKTTDCRFLLFGGVAGGGRVGLLEEGGCFYS